VAGDIKTYLRSRLRLDSLFCPCNVALRENPVKRERLIAEEG